MRFSPKVFSAAITVFGLGLGVIATLLTPGAPDWGSILLGLGVGALWALALLVVSWQRSRAGGPILNANVWGVFFIATLAATFFRLPLDTLYAIGAYALVLYAALVIREWKGNGTVTWQDLGVKPRT